MLDLVSQPLQFMLGAVSQPLWFMMKTMSQPIEKTTHSKHKPKFPCKLCEGDHLTYKCPSIAKVQRVWFHGHPVFEHSEVSQQPTSLSQVGPSHPTSGGHDRGKLSASVGHAKRKQSSTASHVDTVEKTGHSKCKLKFPCKLCEGEHVTH